MKYFLSAAVFLFTAACSSSSGTSTNSIDSRANPSAEAIAALRYLVENDAFTAKTIVTGKGEASNKSCKGRLCSAFGVESVSSDVLIDYMLEGDIALLPPFETILDERLPIYVMIDHKMKNTIRQSGRTRIENKTIRRKGTIKCANEPYMYVFLPSNGYEIRSGGQAEVTVKRTYAPGSSIASFETKDIDGANSPIVKVSFQPFRTGRKQNCWHPDYSYLRP